MEAELESRPQGSEIQERSPGNVHLVPRVRAARGRPRQRADTADRLRDCMIYNGPGSRYIFGIWLALLITFMFGFFVLLGLDVQSLLSPPQDTWTGDSGIENHAQMFPRQGCQCSSGSEHPVGSECSPQERAGGPCNCVLYPGVGSANFLEWVDAESLGVGHKLGDDDFFTMRLPFPFTFYGKQFSLIMVSSNGYFTFGSQHFAYGNTSAIPSAGTPDEMVAVMWSDFDPAGEERVFTYYRPAGRTHDRSQSPAEFVVEWAGIAHYNAPESTCTFEAILKSDSSMTLLYKDISIAANNWAAPSVGFEDAAGKKGLQISYNNPMWPPNRNFALEILARCHTPDDAMSALADPPRPFPPVYALGGTSDANATNVWTCEDHDLELSGDPYCAAYTTSEEARENVCDEGMVQVTGNPVFGDRLVSEACPLSCDACDAEQEASATVRCTKLTCTPCTVAQAAQWTCPTNELCWVTNGVPAMLKHDDPPSPPAIVTCQCPKGLERDLCGLCVATPVSSWSPSMDCAGVCHGDAKTDHCGSCFGGITNKHPLSAVGCNGDCFSQRECPTTVSSSPIVMLASATCIGFTMIIFVAVCRRRAFWRALEARQAQVNHNTLRHNRRTDELIQTLATVVYDPCKDQSAELAGAGMEGGSCCSICLGEFEAADQLTPLHCAHVFHSGCIASWLRVRHTCPLCVRRVVIQRAPPPTLVDEVLLNPAAGSL